jgi:outer membrane protein insertion porin family
MRKEMRNTRHDTPHIVLTFLVLILLAALVAGCASAPRQAGEDLAGPPAMDSAISRVESIDFVNNRKYKGKTLLKSLDFEVGDYLDAVLAESGRMALAEFYRKKGFAYVRVMLNTAELSEGKVVYIIDEGPRIRIKSVTFRGNKAIKTGELREATKTKTNNWFLWPVYYTEEKVAADVDRLRTLYYDAGFLNHQIEVDGDVHITFRIDEGPVYKVGRITVEGNTHFDNETLLKDLELKPGQIYRQRRAYAHARRILRLYRENGYVDVDVEHRPVFAEAGVNIVNIEFNILEGKKFRIGRVDITGNEQTQERVVRRVLDEYDFTPGQLYNADMAPREGGGKLERYLRQMTLAEEAIIRPVDAADGAEDRKDVKIDIKEGLTGMWNPGVGVGSDSGVIGRLVYQQRNFDITDWPESFKEFITMNSFKGAGQTLRVALEPGTEVSQYSVMFTEPYFRDRPTSLDVTGLSYERYRESHDEGRLKAGFGFEQRLRNRWRRSLGFRIENIDVDDVDTDAPKEIYDVKGSNALVGAKVGFGRDMTDDPFTPSAGYSFNTYYEQVTGDHDFGALSGIYVHYTTLHEDLLERRTVLATKVRAATVVGDAPPFEKFYAGGNGAYYGIRGFDYRGVSTRGLQTHTLNPERKDPIGSDWIFLANAEVVMPLVGENFSGLFFVDSGLIDTGSYRASVGTGIQILLPQWFGPVPMRFEVATPFMKDDEDETRVFSFSIGGGAFGI